MKFAVRNLSSDVDSAELKALFSPFGQVDSAEVVISRDTKRSKGFGFVEMPSDTEAQSARKSLSGKLHRGRPLLTLGDNYCQSCNRYVRTYSVSRGAVSDEGLSQLREQSEAEGFLVIFNPPPGRPTHCPRCSNELIGG